MIRAILSPTLYRKYMLWLYFKKAKDMEAAGGYGRYYNITLDSFIQEERESHYKRHGKWIEPAFFKLTNSTKEEITIFREPYGNYRYIPVGITVTLVSFGHTLHIQYGGDSITIYGCTHAEIFYPDGTLADY